LILGIDAISNPSGGGKRHLIEILSHYNTTKFKFEKIVIWSTNDFLSEINDESHIEKKSHYLLNKGYLFRLIWILFFRRNAYKSLDIIFSPFGTYFSNNKKYVSMSQNILPFDLYEISQFGFIYKLKFFLLRLLQKKSFKNAKGVIFISNYARSIINKEFSLDHLNLKVINHGISSDFDSPPKTQKSIKLYSLKSPLKLLYVSSIWPYKHHLEVVRAVSKLRNDGFPISLTIIGNNDYPILGATLKSYINLFDIKSEYIFWKQNIGINDICSYYSQADAFIFSSTCENMPNILIEAMSSGLPILCSKSMPMPEFLLDAGVYFDANNVNDISEKIKDFINDVVLRTKISSKSYELAKKYSWQKCADETFEFLYQNTL